MKKIFAFVILAALVGSAVWWFGDRINDDPTFGKITETEATKYANISFSVDSEWTDNYQLFLITPVTENDAINQATAQEINDDKDAFLQEVSQLLGSRDASVTTVYDLHNNVDVNFASDAVVNFVYTFQQTTDGPRQIVETTRFFDRQSGDRLEIDAFFIDGSDYLNRLSSLARTQLQNNLGDSYDETLVNQGTAAEKANFNNFGVASSEAFFFDFEPGTVAPTEQGVVRVEIQLSDLDDILNRDTTSKVFSAHEAEVARAEEAERQRQAQAEALANASTQSFGAVDCNAQKCLALTFDDGPGASTPELLDSLKTHGARATFFMIGRQVAPEAAVVKRVHDEGHEIGNHTWDHKDLTTLSAAEIRSQIDRTSDAIVAAAGVRPVLVRPPYGAVNDTVVSILNAPVILWNVDPQDWKDRNADTVYNRVIENAGPGSIVLSHDIHETTVQAYARLVPQLIENGFMLVTVSELLGLDPNNPAPQIYYSAN